MTQSGDDIQTNPISTGRRSIGGEDLARHADIFPPSFLRLIDRFLKPAFAAHAGELDGAPFVEIVVRPDGNGLELLLRPDHMLERGTKFMREPAMGDDDDAYHSAP